MVEPRFLALLAAATIFIAAALTLSTAVAREMAVPSRPGLSTTAPSRVAALNIQPVPNQATARLATTALPAAVQTPASAGNDSLLLPLALASMLLLAGGIAYRTVTLLNHEL